ncbi:3'-5' exonuclease [Robertkochia marina]|uniref:3'-5' exonuclease n=1 Tax=Robertkochia marina TaxID=1227945 RepID=A0A4V3UYE5_9FLAO|nr:3'-5' exonuclease [Robertkochia marina]THD69408.1 3'-5' exonuclease [Robertkochia marina]TRZ47331.1 3'-5' exonuclease [Robertkochia marina]
MLHKLPLDHILFLDIETVPETEKYDDLDPVKQDLWAHKSRYQRKEDQSPEEFYERAGIWAEFGKIVCISVGFFTVKNGERQFRTTSFFGEEKELLMEFKNLLETHYYGPQKILCGHNAKEFDFPYIARRMLILGISLPEKLNLFGKKPWEIPHLDTMDLWKFGDFKHYTSLKLLTNVLGIPSPKDDIDGSMVSQVYYRENDLDRIVTYCEKDVVATAQVLLRLRGEDLLTPQAIKHV